MNIDNELIDFLEKRFDERYDERYVRYSVCNNVQANNSKRFADDDKQIALIQHDFAVIKKLMWAMASASIGLLITALFDIIKGAI